MKKKNTSKIVSSILLFLYGLTTVNAQAPFNWTRSTPGYYTGYPVFSTDHQYHESNDVLILSEGSVITAGVKYKNAYSDTRNNFIEKFSSNGTLSNSFKWDFNYNNCFYSSKTIQIEASQNDDVYSLVSIAHEQSYPCFIDTLFTLIKSDANLNMLWNIYFHGEASQFKFVLDANGDPFIAYLIADSSTGGKKIVVEKYSNVDGALLWHKDIRDFNNKNINSLNDLKVDNGGNAYICGSATNTTTLQDFLTVRVNSNGTLVWRKYYDGASQTTPSGDDEALALAIENDQNVVVAGQSYRSIHDYDFLTIKYNPQGDVLWQKRRDVNNTANAGQFVATDTNNNVYVAGNFDENSALIKYDQYGNLLWQKQYNGFTLSEIRISLQGACYLAGSKIFYGTVISEANKAHLKKVLSNGIIEWSYSDPKSLNNIVPFYPEIAYESNYNGLALKENLQQVVASGYTSLITLSASLDYNFANNWRTDCFSPTSRYGTISNAGYNKDVMLVPNPVASDLQFLFNDNDIEVGQVSIIDLDGREVLNKGITTNDETLDVTLLKPGLYVARIVYDGNVINKKFVKE